jgi:aminoglycoside/choline kinase family phosphotransferase
MEKLVELFEQHTGYKPTEIQQLKSAGSNRIYYRLKQGNLSIIGVKGESDIENKAFVDLANHFEKRKLPTPRVYAHTNDYQFYIQEDLGDTSLFDSIENGRNSGNFTEKEKSLLYKTIELLPKIQFEGAQELDFSICYPQAEFDRNTIMWDLNYFKYCFLKSTGIDFLEPALEKDFIQLANDLLSEKTDTFLYRDFQSRNVMIKDNEPYFIDFQGGRKGPVYYDIASFVWQAKAAYPESLREELINHYLQAAKKYVNFNKDDFKEKLSLFVFFRTLQVLGAYGFRGFFEKKPHFIESIPFAIHNLKDILNTNKLSAYPHLVSILQQLCNLPQFSTKEKKNFDTSKLTVRIFSFSYKKGIPEDTSGNGGGYVFDCRGIFNPGRFEEYKTLTGLDKPVIDFLEKNGEISFFLDSVYKLADAHIENYLERGFADLMFCFGCTGGQHRSVYSAEHLATHLSEKYGVKIELTHREQQIFKKL